MLIFHLRNIAANLQLKKLRCAIVLWNTFVQRPTVNIRSVKLLTSDIGIKNIFAYESACLLLYLIYEILMLRCLLLNSSKSDRSENRPAFIFHTPK